MNDPSHQHTIGMNEQDALDVGKCPVGAMENASCLAFA